MLLKSLEIQGFKTFPDRTVLKFEEPLVAVVGPNGSGKSNVSDAIRWVLGEQSTRVLRCSKMEDVIFKGASGRKAMGYAEVTLNIDNSDRKLNFDGDNLAITRRYYRSGDSEYLINKAAVRLRDINELFMDTGLGRDGYSMIGQGKIDSIVAAKSEERREIFEEAAGISRYRYRKEESERRLNRAEDNLVRLRDILSELEERVEPLRIQSEKAQKFIEFDSEKKGLEIGIWVETLNRSGNILRDHEDKINISLSTHNEIEAEIERIAAEIEENYARTNLCTAEMENRRSEASALDEEATRTEGEISVLKNDILHNNQNIERLNSEIFDTSDSQKNIDSDIEEKNALIDAKKAELDGHSKEYIRKADELEELRKGSDDVSRKMEDSSILIAKLKAELAEERVRYSSAASSVAEIKNRGTSLTAALEENEKKLSALRTEEKELKEFLKDTEEKIHQVNNSASGYAMRLDLRSRKAEQVKADLDKVTLDAGEAERRARILEDLERNFEGFTQSVKVVMREASHGMLKGVHGPVTKIINTPAEYAVAIETALGGAMQNIVVSTEQDAKNGINMLKRKDAGRATFMPISTMKGTVIDSCEAEKCLGFIGVASALVNCDPQYNGIRDYLLGRTVVAESMDDATVIARKLGHRYRVVTLDGQVVNAGGSLTGGSLARNSGLLSRSSEIVRIREKAAEYRAKAASLNETYKKFTEEISACQAELELARQEQQSLSEDKIRAASEIKRNSYDIEAAVNAAETIKAEMSGSQERIDAMDKAMMAAFAKISELEQKIREEEEQLASLTGSRRERLEACDRISEALQDIKLAGFAAERDIEVLQSEIASLKLRQTDSAGVIERLKAQITEAEVSTANITEQIAALTAKAEGLRADAKLKRDEIVSIGEKRTELEKRSTELRAEERDAASRRETVGHEMARLQERRDNLQKEYDTIITKLWEEYELTRREAEEQAAVIEDLPKAQRRLTELKNKIRALGSVNVAAVVEYKEVSERYEFLKAQIGDVEKSRLELIKLIAELTTHMKEQFAVRFAEINSNFVAIFKELFGGGTASLSFTDDSDILNSGIEIKVHPPGKIVSHIEALSGGEKALVAISIYFAIMKVSPPPFCMLDEVEAALDDSNVRRFADYLHKMNDNTQFIVVTHRRGTMESSDALYGVTMQEDGISKILSIKNSEVSEKLGLTENM